MTKVHVAAGDPAKERHDLLALFLFEGDKPDAKLDAATGGRAGRVVRLGDFKGKAKTSAMVYGDDGKLGRVLLVGLGPRKGATAERLRRAGGAVVAEARRLEARRVGIVLPPLPDGLDATVAAAATAEAAVLADYAFERHKTKGKDAAAKDGEGGDKGRAARPELTLDLFAPAGAGLAEAVEAAVVTAEATNAIRTIANEPSNHVTPTVLADQAREAGKRAGFKVKVHGPAELKAMGANALLSIAQGSHEPCALIQMEWTPPAEKGKAKGKPAKRGTVVLVGKGLTFDSGGISIKPADKMWEMKFDKCGACAVIGVMIAVARLRLPLHVVGLIPATENMPGGGAVKPGDVVKAMNGKTIEVLNTDAEGRVVLADALSYAARFEPEVCIDVATLTGAVVVALGDLRAAVMGNDQALTDALMAAGDATGELLWPLPMDDGYGEHVKGEVADVKNLGKGRDAGSIAGGWFLKHFVPEGAAWAHLDIAGTAWASSDPGKGYLAKGATGYGVRLLVEYLRRRAAR